LTGKKPFHKPAFKHERAETMAALLSPAGQARASSFGIRRTNGTKTLAAVPSIALNLEAMLS
jgi:hypothetical protein